MADQGTARIVPWVMANVEPARIVLETFRSWEVCSAAAEVASVLSQLRHAKPGRGHHVHQVQLQLEGRRCAEVQGHHADDEPTGCARRASCWPRRSSASCSARRSAWCASRSRLRSAAPRRSAEQAQGHDGRRRTAEHGLGTEAAGSSARCCASARRSARHSNEGRVSAARCGAARCCAAARCGASAASVRTARRQPARRHDGRGRQQPRRLRDRTRRRCTSAGSRSCAGRLRRAASAWRWLRWSASGRSSARRAWLR